jgi:hypothetical protein
MGTMSEGVYNNPNQEQCVGRMLGGSLLKMLHCAHEGCKVKVHRFCQIDWLHRHDLEVNHDDPFFANSTTSVARIMFDFLCPTESKDLSLIKGKAISCGRRVDVCLGLLVCQKVI